MNQQEDKHQEEARQWEANYTKYQEERNIKAIFINIAFVLAIVHINSRS